MKVLGLIPARGGSKGVPGKNIKLLNGRPLLAFTAEAALNSKLLSRVILSTDCEKIAAVGKECGVDVPFMRPATLSTDESPTYPVIMHALEMLKADGEEYDAVCLLQPVCPLRDEAIIDGCIALMQENEADTVFTTLCVPAAYNPYFVYFAKSDGQLQFSMGDQTLPMRRQDVPTAVHREGSVYLASVRSLVKNKSIYGSNIFGFPVPAEVSVNIDTLQDWSVAEQMLRAKK